MAAWLRPPEAAAHPRLLEAKKTENPFSAVTEKMSQSLSVAFTAKCAECGVCERSAACNLSGLFYILHKESAPLRACSRRG